MPDAIDWSKAGTRIRQTPPGTDGRNPDWNWAEKRWKDQADYAGEAMTHGEIAARVACPICAAIVGRFCHDTRERRMDGPHPQRRRLAGEQEISDGTE